MLPGTRGDRVVILNLLAADLIPLRTLRVEIINVEPVEIPDYSGLTGSIEVRTSELLDLLVLGVVKRVEAVASVVVEGNAPIVACREDMRAPGQRLRDRRVRDLVLDLGLKVECQDGVVDVTSGDVLAIR